MIVAFITHPYWVLLIVLIGCYIFDTAAIVRTERSVTSMSAVSGTYLHKIVERKKIEVDRMLRMHQSDSDPLVMRMSYINSQSNFNISKALRRDGYGQDELHTMSVLVDMKRRSPTGRVDLRNIVEYSSAAKFSELLALGGADALMINTEEIEYGGKVTDLKDCVKSLKSLKANSDKAPPCIHKDIIIHPVQIAQALEDGAQGVLLIAAIVGSDLETLLDSCTIMGTEAIVEVHTPNELDFALSKGATIFLVNMWDRMTNRLYPDQAKGMASMLPVNTIAVAAGNICTLEYASELGFYGYDGVVLGRGITQVPDIKAYIDSVHSFAGSPRSFGLGFKGLPWQS
jgi:indole-3-glycerol phosphate synthase